MLQTEKQYVQWQDNQTTRNTRWLSESNQPPPARIVIVDDQTTADEAYRFACEGTSMLWRGDFHNARQLLQALTRRIERTEQRKASKAAKSAKPVVDTAVIPNLFHQQRLVQAQRARVLSRLLLELDVGYVSRLRRAPGFVYFGLTTYGTDGDTKFEALAPKVWGEMLAITLP